MTETLLDRCVEGSRSGKDFPTIWHTILKPSPFVRNVPVQVAPERLEVALTTGQTLVFETATKTFRLE